ncbi:MAG: hypothetical protein Q8R48_03075, partial [Candidatus Omnitrophota bacterium]|nr:hypothetical protein [Candidatus Omnitrophota bacterium]
MKKTITIACLLLLFAISCLETVHAKLQSEGPVRINGEAVEVKVGGTYKPYNIKGLCYQPTPVGQAPDGAWRTSPTAAPPIYARDFQKIQDIKANTVYTFRQVNDMLMDAAADKNIKVIAGFWINSADNLSDANVRTNYITSFMAYVNTYKNHSAVLFWAIGNDTAGYTATNPADIYSLFNEMAQAAYDAEMVGESPRYHPVAVIHRAPVNNEYNDLGVGNIADDAVTPNIDIWGTIVYRQDTAAYGTFLSTINTRTNKPIWIAQWGHDAYHTTQTSPPPPAGSENETEQNDNNVPIANYFTKTVLPNDLIGGTYMEYSDEWCRAGSNSAQNTGGVPNTNILSDGFRNMEYMGVYKIADGGTDPAADVITARELFSGLQAVWNPNMAPVLAAIGNKTAFTGFLLEFTASATDEDNDNLTLDCTNMPAGATFNVITNQPGLVEKKFSWTPAATGSFPGIHFEVSDGSKADSEDIAITVNNPTLVINLNPAGSYTITEGDMLVINPVVQSPAPPCQMTAEMSPEVTDFTFTHNGQGTGTFVWTPATGAGGASYIDYTVTFTATDSTPNAGITTATIRVNKYINSNYAPVWTSPIGDIVIYQDTQLVLPVDLWQYADDEDIIGPSKSSLTFSVVSFTPPEGSQCGAQVYRDEYGHSWLKVIPQTGYFGGPTTLTIRVTDDDPANPKSADTISNVTITQMNPPVVSIISPAAYSAIKGICTIEWTASDPGGNPIS